MSCAERRYIRYTVHGCRPPHEATDSIVPGDHCSEGAPMIAIGFGFLALFSVLSVLLGSEEPRHGDPQDDIRMWMRYGVR